MSAQEKKVVQRRSGGVQRRSAIRGANRSTYRLSCEKKREGSFFSDSESRDVMTMRETKPAFSQIKETFETLECLSSSTTKKPPRVAPKPGVSQTPQIRIDSWVEGDSSGKGYSPESNKSKTLPIFKGKSNETSFKPPVSPKPLQKSEYVRIAQAKSEADLSRGNDLKGNNFPDIHENLKSSLFLSSPVFHGVQKASGNLDNSSQSSSSRSSNRSTSSQGSTRDSGTGSSIADIQQRLSTLDIEEEEPQMERCNSLEELPLDEQLSESVEGEQLEAMMGNNLYVTILSSQEVDKSESASRNIHVQPHGNVERCESSSTEESYDPTYSGERQPSNIKSPKVLHHSSENSETGDIYSKPYMNTHVKTGLFRVFGSSFKPTHSDAADDSIYVNEDISPKGGRRRESGEPLVDQGAMAPAGEIHEDSISGAEEQGDIYENVWIPPSKRKHQKPKSKEANSSMKSVSSASSVQSSHSDVFTDDADDANDDDYEGLGDWSDFDSDEDGSDQEEEEAELREDDKLYNIVRELMKTEQSYVFKIGILVKAKLKAQEILKNEDLKDMFPYIDSIHKLHVDMLEKFKLRLKTWETNRSIGDLVKILGPFLKMYTDYVKHFEAATAFVDRWTARSQEFSRMLKEVVSESQQGKLDIKTYMLEPIQRVPRYQLLLEQYLKHLPEDEETERKEVETALKAVTDSANYFQFAIKQKDQIFDLIHLQNYIDVPIISPERELKKRGPIQRLAVRSGKLCPRYIFLFNDLLLICKEWTLRRIAGYMGYTTLQSMPVDGMEVLDGDNPEHAYMVIVKTTSYVAHFQFGTEEDKLDWLRAFWEVIADRTRSRLRENNKGLSESSEADSEQLEKEKTVGKVAPVWVHDGDVSMCMLCAVDFSLTRRKHHCRGCGSVVCAKCSSRTLYLDYDKQHKRQRVCDECFLLITDNRQVISNKRYISRERQRKCCLCSGEMKKSLNQGKTWEKYWVEVHEGGMLYCFKARLDICAYSDQDLGGCTLELVNFNNQIVFQLENYDSLALFKVDEKEQMLRWLDGFEAAMKDSDAMHFRVDRHQRDFIASTMSRDSLKSVSDSADDKTSMSEVEVKNEFDSPVAAALDNDKRDLPIKSDDAVPDLDMDQSGASSSQSVRNLVAKIESERQSERQLDLNKHAQHVTLKGVTPGKCNVSIGVDISDTIENRESRTIAVQVSESESKPSGKIQSLIARLYKETGQQTEESELPGTGSASISDAVSVPRTGCNASMYAKNSFHRGCQTHASRDNVFLRSAKLNEASDC